MRTSLLTIALLLSLAGCQAGNVTGPGGLTPLHLGSLQFQPASAQTAKAIADRAAATGTAQGSAAPASNGATTGGKPMVPPSPYSYTSYFGGPLGPMKLSSVTEAKTTGASGGWLDVQTQVIAPALKEWAPDARLVSSNGTLNEQGDPLDGANGEGGWVATYASLSQSEVLEFHVAPSATRVVRMHWVPIPLDVASVKVDAKAAIATVTAAIKDSNTQSAEEKLGHDYFFGTSGGDVGIAVPAVSGQANTSGPAIAPAPDGAPMPAPSQETLYTLKPGGQWYVSLQAIGDHLVWELSYNPYATATAGSGSGSVGTGVAVPAGTVTAGPASATPSSTPVASSTSAPSSTVTSAWEDDSAYAMVEARTGELIRLRRPTRYTQPMATPGSTPIPKPLPVEAGTK